MNAAAVPAPRLPSRGFRIALIGNLVWINASEIWRYLAVVRPMIQAIFPGSRTRRRSPCRSSPRGRCGTPG